MWLLSLKKSVTPFNEDLMSELFYKAAGAILAPFRYAEREVQSMKTEAKEDLQAFVANLIKLVLISVVSLLFLLFISITAAAVINDSMDSGFLGWAIVAGFYLVTGIGLYIWKEATDHDKKKPATNARRPIANT
jgi:nicotinamide riboside transporter PnuC